MESIIYKHSINQMRQFQTTIHCYLIFWVNENTLPQVSKDNDSKQPMHISPKKHLIKYYWMETSQMITVITIPFTHSEMRYWKKIAWYAKEIDLFSVETAIRIQKLYFLDYLSYSRYTLLTEMASVWFAPSCCIYFPHLKFVKNMAQYKLL